VSSDPSYLAETMSTLKFAARARLVKTHAIRHEVLHLL
jgi:hypothetical protein